MGSTLCCAMANSYDVMYVIIMLCVMYVMIMLYVMIGCVIWALETLRRVNMHYCCTKMRCFVVKHVEVEACLNCAYCGGCPDGKQGRIASH
jgi:hypothetical protein